MQQKANIAVESTMKVATSPGMPQKKFGGAYRTVQVDGRECPVYRSTSCGKIEYELKYWLSNGKRCRVSSRDGDIAKLVALAEEKITQSKSPSRVLLGEDVLAYNRVLDVSKALKMPPDVIAMKYLELFQKLHGHDPTDAVLHYVRSGMLRCADRLFRDLVDRNLKRTYGSHVTKESLDSRIRRFGEWVLHKLGEDAKVSDVTTELLEEWVLRPELKKEESRKSERIFLTGFFNIAKHAGWYPNNESTPADRIMKFVVPKRVKAKITIYTPDEMKMIIYSFWEQRNKDERSRHILYDVLLGGFGGVRTEERKHVIGENVDREKKTISLPEASTKSNRFRVVPISPNLLVFLEALNCPKLGTLVDGKWSYLTNERIRELGFKDKRNALRHSYASYLSALINDDNLLSKILGNNVKLLYAHYVTKVTVEDAVKYFSIYPPGYTGEIPTVTELIKQLKGLHPLLKA